MPARSLLCIMVLICSTLVLAPAVQATDTNEITIYLWGPDIKGSASIGPATRPLDISFDQLIDKAEAAFMGRYERRGARWGGGADITYLKLSDQQMGFDTEVKVSILELFATYRTSDNFDIIGGVRGTSMNISAQTPTGTQVGSDDDLVDAFIGARVNFPFAEKWALRLRGDIGAGTSELVWNAIVGLDWRFASKWSAKLAYRWLDYDVEGEGPASAPLTTDVQFRGPALAVSYYW